MKYAGVKRRPCDLLLHAIGVHLSERALSFEGAFSCPEFRKDGAEWQKANIRNGLHRTASPRIGITTSTLYDWKNKYSEFSEALKRGKEVVDIEVENALLKRALGYDYTEERVERSQDGGKKSIKTVQTVKHIPPDTTAQIFWLKNRRPDRWRDKQQIEHSGTLEVENPLAGLTTEELRKLADDG